MNRISKFLAFTVVFVSIVYSQHNDKSWSFGFGGSFPRFHSSDVTPRESNVGGYLSLTNNANEHISFRFRLYYNYMTGLIPQNKYFYKTGALVTDEEDMNSSVFGGNLDFMYYLNPCSDIKAYFFFGFGGAHFDSDWGNVVNLDSESKFSMQTNFGLGLGWILSEDWKLKTEFGYYSIGGRMDGVPNKDRVGIFGSNTDSYTGLNVGLEYGFGCETKCNTCSVPEGIKSSPAAIDNQLTKKDVEDLIKTYIPKEVVKEVVIEKPVEKVLQRVVENSAQKPALSLKGIHFKTGSNEIAPESYPVLYEAVNYFAAYPEVNAEIQGHTDNRGNESFNKKLSEGRAVSVMNYLIKMGVAKERLTAVGFGSGNPVATNDTAEGRTMNRRIEFKIK